MVSNLLIGYNECHNKRTDPLGITSSYQQRCRSSNQVYKGLCGGSSLILAQHADGEHSEDMYVLQTTSSLSDCTFPGEGGRGMEDEGEKC